MTPSLAQPAWPWNWPGRLLVGAALAPLVTACASTASQVRLPARPPTSASVTSSAAAVSQRQQVIAALTGYTVALGEADKSGNPATARSLLQPYLAASRIAGIVEQMSSIWARGEVFYGDDVLHILTVTIRGTSALVHDCDDTSGMGLLDAATGQQVAGSAGVPEENVVTRLDLVSGRWLVQYQLVEDVPCTA